MGEVSPVEGQCGTCKFAAAFGYADSPSGPEDGVHCVSEECAKLGDKNTHGNAGYVQELKEYGFLSLWRLEQMAEVSFKCPCWQSKSS